MCGYGLLRVGTFCHSQISSVNFVPLLKLTNVPDHINKCRMSPKGKLGVSLVHVVVKKKGIKRLLLYLRIPPIH